MKNFVSKAANICLAINFITCFGCVSRPIQTSDTEVSSASQSLELPFRLFDNRILVPVFINGDGPFTFVFDTGGARTNTITPEAAKRLNLVLSATTQAKGAGSGTVQAWSTQVANYKVGDLVLKNQKFTVLDLSIIRKAFNFPALDGIIGLDVLKQTVACIDFDREILKLTGGDANCFKSKGTVLPFRLDGKTPTVQATINGVPAEISLDTGDRSAFSIFQKFAERSGIKKEFDPKPEIITGVGVGGPIPAKMTILKEIKLGSDITLSNVLSRLPLATGNYFAKSEIGGTVGNEILRRFNVIFDYGRSEVTLIKNSHFDDPYKFTPPVID